MESRQPTFEELVNDLRGEIKGTAKRVNSFERGEIAITPDGDIGEVWANLKLSYRHLEDASMRLGKVLQALDGGVSVYDKDTTVGA